MIILEMIIGSQAEHGGSRSSLQVAVAALLMPQLHPHCRAGFSL